MESKTYIIGHKNPDADSICSAIAYGDFKQQMGEPNFIPARCGNINPRIDTILNQFGVAPPLYLGDVTPRVRDIMVPFNSVRKLDFHDTVAEALKVFDESDHRALPVVDDAGKLHGIVSIFNLGEYFIPKLSNPEQLRKVKTNLDFVVRSLEGTAHHLVDSKVIEEFGVRVGAADEESFGEFAKKEGGEPHRNIIVTGDNPGVQRKAINMGVRLLVLTKPAKPEIIALAKNKGVSLIESPHDTAATAWLIRASTLLAPMVQTDISTYDQDEPLAKISAKIVNRNAPIFCVTDKDNKLLGLFTKSDIIKPIKTNLVLVDHNELNQSVNGADKVNITEIIDHHKLGNIHTPNPIRFINEPLGSTCTIVARMYFQQGLTPSPAIAGLLMGGIISDTLNLKSPTTTDVDRQLLPELGKIARMDPDRLAEIIFSSGSVILSSTPDEVLNFDTKHFSEGDRHYSVAQIEELGFGNFWDASARLHKALVAYRQANNLAFSFLLVTDINHQNSLLLADGDPEILEQISYPSVERGKIFELNGVVSRKKQLIPYLTSLLAAVQTT